MKHNELLSHDLAIALINHTFNTREKNRAVFDYYNSVKQEYEYVFNEASKIKSLDLSDDEQNEKFELLLNEEISVTPKFFFLEKKDFDEENCLFPKDKNLWLNEIKINGIINWCNDFKIKTEKE